MARNEYSEIYITGVGMVDDYWVNNPDFLLDDIKDALAEIKRFNFISISLNMSQVYNVRLKLRSYNSMMMYIKGINFKGESYFEEDSVKEIKKELRKYLSYIYGFNLQNIELRCYKKYNYEVK